MYMTSTLLYIVQLFETGNFVLLTEAEVRRDLDFVVYRRLLLKNNTQIFTQFIIVTSLGSCSHNRSIVIMWKKDKKTPPRPPQGPSCS